MWYKSVMWIMAIVFLATAIISANMTLTFLNGVSIIGMSIMLAALLITYALEEAFKKELDSREKLKLKMALNAQYGRVYDVNSLYPYDVKSALYDQDKDD